MDCHPGDLDMELWSYSFGGFRLNNTIFEDLKLRNVVKIEKYRWIKFIVCHLHNFHGYRYSPRILTSHEFILWANPPADGYGCLVISKKATGSNLR